MFGGSQSTGSSCRNRSADGPGRRQHSLLLQASTGLRLSTVCLRLSGCPAALVGFRSVGRTSRGSDLKVDKRNKRPIFSSSRGNSGSENRLYVNFARCSSVLDESDSADYTPGALEARRT